MKQEKPVATQLFLYSIFKYSPFGSSRLTHNSSLFLRGTCPTDSHGPILSPPSETLNENGDLRRVRYSRYSRYSSWLGYWKTVPVGRHGHGQSWVQRRNSNYLHQGWHVCDGWTIAFTVHNLQHRNITGTIRSVNMSNGVGRVIYPLNWMTCTGWVLDSPGTGWVCKAYFWCQQLWQVQ